MAITSLPDNVDANYAITDMCTISYTCHGGQYAMVNRYITKDKYATTDKDPIMDNYTIMAL